MKKEPEWMEKLLKGLSFAGPIIPAICLIAFAVSALSGYAAPQSEQTVQAAADIDVDSSDENNTSTATTASKKDTTEASGAFDKEDGTYSGSAQGYGGTISVNVTIASKKITAIDVTNHSGETDAYYNRATGVIDEMISKQSVDVDVVSGATYSSNGIIGAVKNALYGTESSGNNASSTTASSNSSTQAADKPDTVDESNVTYKDGTYEGSAKGFGGTITVRVTISGGKITAIDAISHSGETDSYFNNALSIINTIISKKSTNVDTVSGATFSSTGIINAVRNALEKAKTSDNSDSTTATTQSETDSTDATTESDAEDDTSSDDNYTDGSYKATVYCPNYKYAITAKVTIKNGKITSCSATAPNCGAANQTFFDSAKNSILKKVVASQSASVDTVSGATYSSKGIISAIKAALSKAKSSGESDATTEEEYDLEYDDPSDDVITPTATPTPATATPTPTDAPATVTPTESPATVTPTPASIATPTPVPTTKYKDGTYTASAYCAFGYSVTVSVTILNDQATSVSISNNDTGANAEYIAKCEPLLPGRIQGYINGTKSKINAVSGATYTSNSVISAVNEILTKASN